MLVAAVILQPFIDPRFLFLDPVVAAQLSTDCCRTYYGWLSTLGVMMWTAAAAVCGFAAFCAAGRQDRDRNGVVLLAAAGGLTGLMAVDDAFLLHERILPALGVHQHVMLAAYAALALGYLAAGVRFIRQVNTPLFLAAGFFLAASMGLDLVQSDASALPIALEDGSKLIGLTCWTVFHIDAAAKLLRGELRGAGTMSSKAIVNRLNRAHARSAPGLPVRHEVS